MLADFGGAAENGDTAAAVEFQLHAGMGHLVPVDGEAGSSEIGGAGDAYAAAFGEFAEFFFPIGDFHHSANAFGKIDGAQAEIIRGHGIGSFDDAEA